MALGALEAQLKAMTECKICYENKDHQKQLPCQHTLCVDCLNKLTVENSKYRCPICNAEYLVPNGGYDSLPESLITKQLASLLNTREWETAATKQRTGTNPKTVPNTGGVDNDDSRQLEENHETEAGKKLRFGVSKSRNALKIAEQKIATCSHQQVELQRNLEKMEEKIQELKAEKIAAVEERANKKLEALRKATEIKTAQVATREAKLKSSLVKTQEMLDELEKLADELNKSGTERDVTQELQTANSNVTELNQLFTPPDATVFKTGDSVRLRMDSEVLKPEFFDEDLTHNDIGYILERNDKERCAVMFPHHSAWTGSLSQLERSAERHTLPIKGDRVRVKSSVETPHFEWGMVKPGSIGTLINLKQSGTSTRREVEVKFPEGGDWKCYFDELEVAPPEPLLVGDEVWVKKEITEPAGGWAGVTHSSKGTLLSVNGDDVLVNFTECREWRGLLTELEKVRPISVGDKVKVMKSVSEPKTGWAGVSHTDEGIVKVLHDNQEHGKVALIDFPNRLGLWKCLVSELELVERQAESQTQRNIQIQLPGGLDGMQRLQHSAMERHAEQCAQQ